MADFPRYGHKHRIRPGSLHVWWDFLNDVVVPEEWREHIRTCKDSFLQLRKELHRDRLRENQACGRPCAILRAFLLPIVITLRILYYYSCS